MPCRKTLYYKFLLKDLRNVLVVGGVSLECIFFKTLQSLGDLGTPSCEETGDRVWQKPGWLVCGNAKVVFAVGCLGNSSAAKRLWYSLFLEKGSSPCDWPGSRAMPSVPAALATSAESALDVLPVTALVLVAGGGRYFELVWLHSEWTLHLIVRAARPALNNRYPLGYHRGLKSMSGLSLGTLSPSCTCWTPVSPTG